MPRDPKTCLGIRKDTAGAYTQKKEVHIGAIRPLLRHLVLIRGIYDDAPVGGLGGGDSKPVRKCQISPLLTNAILWEKNILNGR